MKLRNKIIFFSVLLVGAFSCSYFGMQLALWGLADTFTVANISSNSTFQGWDVTQKHNRDELERAISQPYHYLCKGSQCYVFASEDDRYVIKFFRQNRFRLPRYLERLPLPYFMEKIHARRKVEKAEKREALFQSCHLAYELLQEECALVYMHLNKGHQLQKSLLIHDAIARPYAVNLDDYEFYIQRKGEPLWVYLNHLIDEEPQEVRPAMEKVFKLLCHRFKKGIDDHDPVLQKNAGFVNGEPAFLDIGGFYQNKSLKDARLHVQKISDISYKLKLWMAEKDQAAADDLERAIEILY